jgi:predicted  nucleic acid-binding Zn-ribbon protein
MVAEFTITIPSDIESNVYEVIWRHLGDLRSLHGKKFTEIVSRYDKEITAQDGNKTNISKLIKELNKEFASAVKTLEQAVIEQIKKDYSAHAKRRKDYKIGIAMDSFKAVFNVGKAVTGIVLKPADPFAWVGLANSLYKTFKSIEKYTQAIDTARADMDEILKTVKDELAKSSPESSKLKKAVAKSRSAIKDYNKKIKQLDDKIDKEFGVMRANLYVINNQMVKDPDFKDVAGEFSKLFDSIVTLNQGLLNHQNNAFDAMDIVDNVNDFLGRTDDGAFKTFLKDRIALFQATDLLPLLPMVQFIPGAEAAGKTTGKVLTVIKAAENLVDVAEKLTKKKK